MPSPVVCGDRVFVVACRDESQERVLACYDRASGKPLWQQTVLRSPLESKHALNSFASSTPATDGELVYVSFLEVGDEKISAPDVGAQANDRPRPDDDRGLRLQRQPTLARKARRFRQRPRLLL